MLGTHLARRDLQAWAKFAHGASLAERRVRPSSNENRRTQTRSVKLSVTRVSPPTRPMRNALGQEGTGQSRGPRSRGLGAQMFNGGLVLSAIEYFCPVPVVPEFQIPPDKIASRQATSRSEFSLDRLQKSVHRTQTRSIKAPVIPCVSVSLAMSSRVGLTSGGGVY